MAESTSKNNLPANDVLHFENQSHLTAEQVAKAVARHKREHPEPREQKAAEKPRKRA